MAHSPHEIQAALEAFSANTQLQGRKLRDMLDNSPEEFKGVVREFLLGAQDTPETRYVLALLSTRGLLLPFLEEIARSDRNTAAVLAQLVRRMDPSIERTIARMVMESVQASDGTLPDPEFLLGLLEGLNGGMHLFATLGDLRRSEDPRLRSKMALLLGRAARAQEWFHSLKDDPDPRVRANAVESLWSSDGPFASACFFSALQDPHQRVVGNALVGLYLQGDSEAVAGLAAMAGHANPLFRTAAAWSMGRTGDPRFVELLRQMRRNADDQPSVARNALQAIGRINKALNAGRRETVRVAAVALRRIEDGRLEATLVAREPGAAGLPVARPTDWQIRADGRGIWSYQARQIDTAGSVAFGFLFPSDSELKRERERLWASGLGEALRYRRSSDYYAVGFYGEAPRTQYTPHTGEILRLSASAQPVRQTSEAAYALLAQGLGALAPYTYPIYDQELAAGPLRPLRALSELLDANLGERHVMVVLDEIQASLFGNFEPDRVSKLLSDCQATLHVVLTRHVPAQFAAAFSRLAAESGGTRSAVGSVEEAARAVADIVVSVCRSHRLVFAPPLGASAIEVELVSEHYQGKLALSSSELEALQPTVAS